MGIAVAQWLRCCATNRKVAGSIPAGVSGLFIDIKSFRPDVELSLSHVEKRNKHTKKNCAPSWRYLQAFTESSLPGVKAAST